MAYSVQELEFISDIMDEIHVFLEASRAREVELIEGRANAELEICVIKALAKTANKGPVK